MNRNKGFPAAFKLGMDGMAKTLLSDSQFVSRIVKEVVEEAKGHTLEEISAGLALEEDGRTVKNLYPEIVTFKGKIIYDALTELTIDGKRVLIDFEVQGKPEKGMLWRQSTYAQGLLWYERFTLSRGYDEMFSAYSIWIILNPREGLGNTVVVHASPDLAIGIGGSLSAVLDKRIGRLVEINVGNPDEAPDELTRFLGTVFCEALGLGDRIRRTKADYNIDLLDDYYRKVISTLATLDEDYMRGRMRVAREAGIKEGMEKGIEEGMEKGMERGMEKGMERGMEIAAERMAQDYARSILSVMRASGCTLDEAMDMMAVPEDIAGKARAIASSKIEEATSRDSRSERHAYEERPVRQSSGPRPFTSGGRAFPCDPGSAIP